MIKYLAKNWLFLIIIFGMFTFVYFHPPVSGKVLPDLSLEYSQNATVYFLDGEVIRATKIEIFENYVMAYGKYGKKPTFIPFQHVKKIEFD